MTPSWSWDELHPTLAGDRHPHHDTAPHDPELTTTPSLSSLAGVAISTYAKYCYNKLQKAALTGAKKVRSNRWAWGGQRWWPPGTTEGADGLWGWGLEEEEEG